MSGSTLQRHPFHLVDPSPWPIFGSLSALCTTIGAVMWMHSLCKWRIHVCFWLRRSSLYYGRLVA